MTGSPPDRDLVVVKVGGSVLTRKWSAREFDPSNVDRLVRGVARAGGALYGRVVLVLGGGSFGHQIFLDHDIEGGQPVHEEATAVSVNVALADYARQVVDRFRDHDVPAVHVGLTGQDGVVRGWPGLVDAVGHAVAAQHVPVVSGGVLAVIDDGLSAVSSDRIATGLAVACGASAVVMVSNVPGVLEVSGGEETVVPTVCRAELDRLIRSSGVLDRTGGMREKVTSLTDAADCGVAGIITGEEVLDDARLLLVPDRLSGTRVLAGPGGRTAT